MALKGKQIAFVNAYLGEANFNATEAARIAGYSGNDNTLAQVGFENLRKPNIAELIAIRLKESAMSAEEVLKRIGGIARNDKHKGQIKALELLAKHYGLFEKDNRTNVRNLNIDVSTLTDDQLKRLAAGEDILAILSDE